MTPSSLLHAITLARCLAMIKKRIHLSGEKSQPFGGMSLKLAPIVCSILKADNLVFLLSPWKKGSIFLSSFINIYFKLQFNQFWCYCTDIFMLDCVKSLKKLYFGSIYEHSNVQQLWKIICDNAWNEKQASNLWSDNFQLWIEENCYRQLLITNR